MFGDWLEKIGMPKKVAYQIFSIVVSIVDGVIASKYPMANLPSPDMILALGALVIFGHSVVDGVATYNQTKIDWQKVADQAVKDGKLPPFLTSGQSSAIHNP